MNKKILMCKDGSDILEYEKIQNKIEYYFNNKKIDRFDLLASAANSETETQAWRRLKLASKMFHFQEDETFNILYREIALGVVRAFYENEFTIQSMFKENVEKILGSEYHLLKEKKNNPRHIPDAWVTFEDQEIPVEVKYNTFDKKALKQLQRYMKVYKSKTGIAIGRTLGTYLPDNIRFVSISDMNKKIK